MARTTQGRADIALLSDPGATKVVIPFLSALSTPFGRDTTFVRFAGDTYPTAWHGEGRSAYFPLTCLFPRARHDQLDALLRLLRDVAPAAPDPRLLLRTHAGLVPGLNAASVVEVDGEVTPNWSAAMVTVAFTVRVVEYDWLA